jgi:hypothetical protein
MTNHSIDDLLNLLPEAPDPDRDFEDRVRRLVAAELHVPEREVVATRADAERPTTTEVVELDTTTITPTRIDRNPRFWFRTAAAVVLVAGVVAAIATVRRDEPGISAGSRETVFEDGFDDDSAGWTTGSSPGVVITTGGGEQVWTLKSAGLREILRPFTMTEDISDMEVTADVISMDPGATVGVLCRKGQIAAEDGSYAFRLGGSGASIVGPEQTAPLAADPTVAVPSGPFSLTGRCVDEDGVAQLEMLIDGEVVLTAHSESPLDGGVAGLEGIADPDVAPDADPQIVLDRLVATQIH